METPLSDIGVNSDVVTHKKMGGLPLVKIATKSYESDTVNSHDHVIASSSFNILREITLSENETHMENKIPESIIQRPIETTNVINNIYSHAMVRPTVCPAVVILEVTGAAVAAIR